MQRALGISLLFLALAAASFEGFRDRERTRNGATNPAQTQDGAVHSQEGGMAIPPAWP